MKITGQACKPAYTTSPDASASANPLQLLKQAAANPHFLLRGEGITQFRGNPLQPLLMKTGMPVQQMSGAVMQRMTRANFLKENFQPRQYIPPFGMGKFDLSLMPEAGVADVTVKMYVHFSDEKAAESKLGVWTALEKQQWKTDAMASVSKVWNNMAQFKIQNGDWEPIFITPRFHVSFVEDAGEAHVATTAVKEAQPMSAQGIWNVGRNGLMQDQFTDGPQATTRAVLSQIAPAFRNDKVTGSLNHNIFAHEYGHMIGLADEYDNETDLKTGPGVRQKGNVDLMKKYGYAEPQWGTHTKSLMSDGSQLFLRHFVTVQDALQTRISEKLPGSSVHALVKEGAPMWMELKEERMNINNVVKNSFNKEVGLALIKIQDSLIRELDYEEGQIARAGGDMTALFAVLGKLKAQRKEYYDVTIKTVKEREIDWQGEAKNKALDDLLASFLKVAWA